MSTSVWKATSVALRQLLCWLVAVSAIPRAAGQEFGADVEMISFDAKGKLTPNSSARLEQLLAGAAPTHVFIVSHGWNNSFSEAQDSYRRMIRKMQTVASDYRLLDPSYKSLVLGVSWPSKAGDEESAGRS